MDVCPHEFTTFRALLDKVSGPNIQVKTALMARITETTTKVVDKPTVSARRPSRRGARTELKWLNADHMPRKAPLLLSGAKSIAYTCDVPVVIPEPIPYTTTMK
jgi:hypothetical protein